ncbi:MAG: hypothetical protein U0X91_29565 [Spirosomataceae bacterium]
MNTSLSNPSLWQKISDFPLDDAPEAAVQFSDKLIKEQKWRPDFAKRAMAEYKKFLYLCLTMPQGASPSETVDEVWHLHLTYTESYWQKLCGQVLQRELHHYPNKGGAVENQRHRDWYADTLVAYVKEFQELPPADCWPLPKGLDLEPYLEPDSPFRAPVWEIASIWDRQRYWPIGAAVLGVTSLLLFLLAGPHFLLAYLLLMAWAWRGTYLKLRFKKQVLQEATHQLHPYHFAALFKDTETVFRTLVADFAERGRISYQHEGMFVYDKSMQQPMMYSLQAQEEKAMPVERLRGLLYPYAQAITNATKAVRRQLRGDMATGLFQGWVLLIGIARLFQGMLNRKPVLFLLLLMLVYVIVWVIISQTTLIDRKVRDAYQSTEWGTQITEAAFSLMLFNASYSLGNDQTLQRVFGKVPATDSGSGWLGGAAYAGSSEKSDGGTGCSSGDGGGGGCGCGGGCGGCGGS